LVKLEGVAGRAELGVVLKVCGACAMPFVVAL
jgi:hypothetical protein